MNKESKSKVEKQSDKPDLSKSADHELSGMGTGMSGAGNIDKIRDILFGNQAKDYEKRFIRMENQLIQESGELKEELLKRIDSLELYVKKEMKDINDRIKKESDERVTSDKGIHQELKESFEALNKKILQEETNLAEKSTELRDQILEQSKQLSAEIRSKADNASNSLKQTANELDDAKVNRSDLSGFFLELAMRLSGDQNLGSSGNING